MNINKNLKMLLVTSTVMLCLYGCKTSNDIKNDVVSDVDDFKNDISENMPQTDSNYDVDDSMSEYSSEALDAMANSINPSLESLDNTKQGWGQGNNKNEKNQPIGSIDFQEKYGKYNAHFIGNLDSDNIYLTFDEGYENGFTAPILDTLKEKNVSAVFFVTYPYAKDNPELIDRMIKEGHIIGNHSVKHKSFPTLSIDECKEEISGLHDYIKENYNYEMSLFRFPCGEFSERTLEILNQSGYSSVFWSYAYADWDPKKQMSPETAKEKIISSAHKGAIYLLHAVSKTNSEILGDVIDQLRSNGYNISKFESK